MNNWEPTKGERVGYNVGAGMQEGTYIGKSSYGNGFYAVCKDNGQVVSVLRRNLYRKATADTLYKAA